MSRRRSRRGATVAVALAAAALSGAPFVQSAAGSTAPDEPQLPRVVNTPGTWSDDESLKGPLAALGLALRTRPVGLTGKRQALAMFGVSGVDGRSVWVTLSRVDLDERPLVDWFALSPDGRWIGWTRAQTSRGQRGAGLAGWAVMDTTTGEVRSFEDPTHPRLRPTMSELAFSGDSRYLLTSYERPRTRL